MARSTRTMSPSAEPSVRWHASHQPRASLRCARPARADLLTTAMESAYYGRATSSSAGGGIVLVKTRRALILATYAAPVTAAEAIPYTHRFADQLDALTAPV